MQPTLAASGVVRMNDTAGGGSVQLLDGRLDGGRRTGVAAFDRPSSVADARARPGPDAGVAQLASAVLSHPLLGRLRIGQRTLPAFRRRRKRSVIVHPTRDSVQEDVLVGHRRARPGLAPNPVRSLPSLASLGAGVGVWRVRRPSAPCWIACHHAAGGEKGWGSRTRRDEFTEQRVPCLPHMRLDAIGDSRGSQRGGKVRICSRGEP